MKLSIRNALVPLLATVTFFLASASASTQDPAPPPPVKRVELVVYAATSTRDALTAIAKEYERARPVTLVFNFGSSGDLAKQILAARKADVFLSADVKELDRVAEAKLVLDGTRWDLLSNQLVVIEHFDPEQPELSRFTKPFAPEQLAAETLTRLSLANVETVPAGRYAKEWLERVKVWPDVVERVVPAIDVRAALAAVESGAIVAGIVYRTDVARSKRARRVHAVPLEEGPKIRYPIAALRDRPAQEEVVRLVEFVRGVQARKLFEEHGFIVLGPVLPGGPPDKQ